MITKKAWLRRRKSGIGGTDIAAILGLSPYKSAVDVWREKTSPELDQKDSDAMYWGRQLEAVIADHFAAKHSVRLHRIHGILRHPEYDWAIGTPDRAIAEYQGARVRVSRGRLTGASELLEIKTAGAHDLKNWVTEYYTTIPVHYVAQCMWYLAVTGLRVCHVAALIGGQRYIESRVERDEKTIAEMLRIAGKWWQRHIIEGIPPEPKTSQDLQILAPKDSGRSMEASTELADLIFKAARLHAEKLAIEKAYGAMVEQIQMAMGDAAEITLEGHRIVSWRASADRKIVDWEAIARELAGGKIPEEIISRHTSVRAGARRFLLHIQAQLPAAAELRQIEEGGNYGE